MNKVGFKVDNSTDTIELRCNKCNMKIMEYKLQHDDKACALNGISLKCTRCKRIMILMRYTEAIIREGSAVADGRMVKKI